MQAQPVCHFTSLVGGTVHVAPANQPQPQVLRWSMGTTYKTQELFWGSQLLCLPHWVDPSWPAWKKNSAKVRVFGRNQHAPEKKGGAIGTPFAHDQTHNICQWALNLRAKIDDLTICWHLSFFNQLEQDSVRCKSRGSEWDRDAPVWRH